MNYVRLLRSLSVSLTYRTRAMRHLLAFLIVVFFVVNQCLVLGQVPSAGSEADAGPNAEASSPSQTTGSVSYTHLTLPTKA